MWRGCVCGVDVQSLTVGVEATERADSFPFVCFTTSSPLGSKPHNKWPPLFFRDLLGWVGTHGQL